jgi:hypothetical protein
VISSGRTQGTSKVNSKEAVDYQFRLLFISSGKLRESYATRQLKMTLDEVIAHEQKLNTKSTEESKYYQRSDENPSLVICLHYSTFVKYQSFKKFLDFQLTVKSY